MVLDVVDPSGVEDSYVYSTLRIADLPMHLADDSPVMTQIGHESVVHVYTAWEHHFRPGLSAALGFSQDDLRFPLLGDLRRMRNDIVHHRGIATREQMGRCEQRGHWFASGQNILIREQEVAGFMRRFPWAELKRLAEVHE